MRLKVDKNLPGEATARLREAGFDAVSVLDQDLRGAADGLLALVCQREGRAILTLDTDFADIRVYRPAAYAGIVVLRLPSQDRDHVLDSIRRLIPILRAEPADGQLWIVEHDRLRVRGRTP